MPLLLWPLLAGGAGFVGGLWTSDALTKLGKIALIGGAGYLAYTQMVKK